MPLHDDRRILLALESYNLQHICRQALEKAGAEPDAFVETDTYEGAMNLVEMEDGGFSFIVTNHTDLGRRLVQGVREELSSSVAIIMLFDVQPDERTLRAAIGLGIEGWIVGEPTVQDFEGLAEKIGL